MEVFIFAALCGVVIGIFSGLLGIGGGTIMVPLFRLAFGLPAICATATSLFAIIPTSISGCVTHLKNKTCIPLLGLITGLAGAITSAVGVYLATLSPSWLIMLAAALIIVYSSYTMFKKAMKCPKEPAKARKKEMAAAQSSEAADGDADGSADGAAKGATASAVTGVATTPANGANTAAAVGTVNGATQGVAQSGVEQSIRSAEKVLKDASFVFTKKKVLLAIMIGLVAGLASGYVGVGGGFIMVPMFISILGVMMSQASGTSLLAVCILALPGVIEQGILGNIDYIAGIAIVCGSIPGAVIGANLAKKIPERKLRFVFSGFLLFAAVMLLGNELFPFAG
ncbi:MAG: sulfite exporter TauE/SafE family protein [Anaerotardibacter sp.]